MSIEPRQRAYRRASARRGRPALGVLACAVCLAGFTHAIAGEFQELTIEQALQILETRGLRILYSSDLVQPWMRVRSEPLASDARAILDEIVAPYALQIIDGPNESLLLVRATSPARSADGIGDARRSTEVGGASTPPLEEVVVSASQYRFLREPAVSFTSIAATDLQLLPDIGDDPMRAIARLPGTAGSEFGARTNLRGGEADETLIRFDGLRLQNPFHLKDFQGTFSTIDPAVVGTMRVHAGGFPVVFGDRMSGVIEIDPLAPSEPAYREVALSFFNASALAAGRFGAERGEWLVSARRGNLDLLVDVVNSKIGRPRYADFYGRASRRVADSLTVAGNLLLFDDAIVLFDGDREEQARAEYRDAYYWLRFAYQPNDALSGTALVSRSDLDSSRRGSADQEGIASGELRDERAFTIDTLQIDGSWHFAPRTLLQFGGEWRGMRGNYDYSDEVEFDVLFLTAGASTETSRARFRQVRAAGDQYGAYSNLRVEASGELTADVGLRWDRQTLTAHDNDQVSPRLSLLYALGERTRVRASWGRFYQAQAISELQIADGEVDFFPPQRSDHLVAGLEHRLIDGTEIRLEAYRKDYRQVRPRYENLLNTFVLLPELKPDRIRIAPERATATGVELTLRRNGGRPLSWWLSYSWSSVRDEIGDAKFPRSWDQTHLVTGGLAWQSERWELSLAGTHHTGWPTTAVQIATTEPIPLVAAERRNGRRLGSYRTLDMRVARKFHMERAGTLTAFLEVNNVLNRRNECCVEYEVESEDVPGELVLDRSTRGYLPLLPSLGFVWRF